ncbi:MAG TPA: hypothetical protein VF177_09130 [Anaerolineae bacterium]
MRQLARYWEDEARDLSTPTFWDDKQFLRAGLKSGLALLRLLTSQAAQAIEAGQKETVEVRLGRTSSNQEAAPVVHKALLDDQ